MIVTPGKLKRAGVLGMNARNGLIIGSYNRRSLYPKVDNKLLTKELLQGAKLAVPELYGVISGTRDLKALGGMLTNYKDFVIKPARGSGGEGILVIVSRDQNRFVRTNGEELELDDLSYHISGILHGLYSLGGQPDQAIIEYRVKFDPIFEQVTVRGVPDIRLIMFLGVPVMAMLRLPTSKSNGRANLHQGAVGAGVRLSDGTTTSAVLGSSRIDKHPDTGHSVKGLWLPNWDKVLGIAIRCQELVGLGYLGVDIVFDQERGPLILELNARPGLAVQIANDCGLMKRLELVEQNIEKLALPEQRIEFAKAHFD